MRIDDRACLARGFVNPSFVDISTGKRLPFEKRNNTLSFMSAEAMAAAFGGDPSYIPARMGFIYGYDEAMPTESVITRNQDWDSLLEELASSEGSDDVDIQVVGFSFHPTLGAAKPSPVQGDSSSGSYSSDSGSDSGSDSSEGDYNHILSTGSNAITFHAVSNSHDSGIIRSRAFKGGDRIYQAVLLAFHEGKHYVLSRVSLKEGDAYLQKPSGFEIALDWTVVFK